MREISSNSSQIFPWSNLVYITSHLLKMLLEQKYYFFLASFNPNRFLIPWNPTIFLFWWWNQYITCGYTLQVFLKLFTPRFYEFGSRFIYRVRGRNVENLSFSQRNTVESWKTFFYYWFLPWSLRTHFRIHHVLWESQLQSEYRK